MFLAPDNPAFDDVYGPTMDGDPDTWPCARCGQEAFVEELTDCADAHVCDSCQQQDRAPQGEAMRLFAPAPTQITGQLNF